MVERYRRLHGLREHLSQECAQVPVRGYRKSGVGCENSVKEHLQLKAPWIRTG
jgi:hypothetical protein